MKRGQAAVALIVILVGVLGLGLLVAERMSQPTGMPIRIPKIPVLPSEPSAPAQAEMPTTKPLSEPGESGTTLKCECTKLRRVEGDCNLADVKALFFYKGTAFKPGDVYGWYTKPEYPKTDWGWVCIFASPSYTFEHFISAHDPFWPKSDDSVGRQMACQEAAKQKIKCTFTTKEREKTDPLIYECAAKAKALCKSTFYQGEMTEYFNAYSK